MKYKVGDRFKYGETGEIIEIVSIWNDIIRFIADIDTLNNIEEEPYHGIL